MSQPFTLAYRNEVADRILPVLDTGPKPCWEIAQVIGMDRKEAYSHLKFMAHTLGLLRREKIDGGAIWVKAEEDAPVSDIKRVIWSDWPRGEHSRRDHLVAALFGRGGTISQAES
jgi:hypothetical protein